MLADILCVFGLLAMVQMIIYSTARAMGVVVEFSVFC